MYSYISSIEVPLLKKRREKMGLGTTFTGENGSTANQQTQQIQTTSKQGFSGNGLIGGAISGIADLFLSDRNASRQWKREKEAAQIQLQNQKNLNEFNQNLQFDMWKKTNYPEQVKQLELAGLSPALMYGQGGGGGSSTGSTGSTTSTPNAPSQQPQPTGMAIQTMLAMELQKAQIENINANTEKQKVEAIKTGGADTENIKADTALKGLQADNQILQNNITSKNTEEIINTVYANARKAEADAGIATVNARIATESEKQTLYKIKNESIQSLLNLIATKENINYTKEQTKAIGEQLAQGWLNANSNRTNALSNQKNADTNQNVNVHRQIQDALYQHGVLELGDRKLNQDLILGLLSILEGTPIAPTPIKGFGK